MSRIAGANARLVAGTVPDTTAICSCVFAANTAPPLIVTTVPTGSTQPSGKMVSVTGAVMRTRLPCAEHEWLTSPAWTFDACVRLRTQLPPTQLSDVAGGATTTLCTLVLVLPAMSVIVSLAVKVANVVVA